jgi:23S rRNA pseudouridine955/2504/2580 synthase
MRLVMENKSKRDGEVTLVEVRGDEAEMRLDRWFRARYPAVPFGHLQKLMRSGQVRVDGRRAKGETRVAPGQIVRVPPLARAEAEPKPAGAARRTAARAAGAAPPRAPLPDADGSFDAAEARAFLNAITLHEDEDMLVIDKPFGLAVQGGPGIRRSVDHLLAVIPDRNGQRPRLVHRLDKDTSGCLVIARSRLAAATLAKTFRSRAARKIYWSLVVHVPRIKQGRISTFLAKGEGPEGIEKMVVANQGDEGAEHAVTYYAVVETAAQKLAWLSMKPVTGRTHQLRAHAAHIGHPIIGDPKYFDKENWQLPGGIQNRLHLLARRIVIPHPRTGGPVDVTAPLPAHMAQSWNLLGFDAKRYDPIVEASDT